mgnify:FL=1
MYVITAQYPNLFSWPTNLYMVEGCVYPDNCWIDLGVRAVQTLSTVEMVASNMPCTVEQAFSALFRRSVGIYYHLSTVGDLSHLLLCQVFIIFPRLLEMFLKVFHQMVCTWNFHNISSVWHLHRNKNMYGNNHSYAYCFLTLSLKYIPSKTKILHLHQVFLEK